MLNYYIITAVLALINLLIFIFVFDNKRSDFYFVLIALFFAISNCGYLSVALSSNVEEALLANKLCYLGGCFSQPTALLLLCAICNYNVKNAYRNVAYIFSFIVYALVLSTGYSDIYYVSSRLETVNGVSVLQNSYGKAYFMFYLLLFGFLMTKMAILIYSTRKNYTVSQKSLVLFIVLEMLNVVSFIVAKIIPYEIEITPLFYVIDGFIFLWLYHRGAMYNMEENVSEVFDVQQRYGCVMLDKSLRFLGCNMVAQKIFPDIGSCKVDEKVIGRPEFDMILSWIRDYSEEGMQETSYQFEDRHHKCRMGRLWRGEKAIGFIIVLEDDTDQFNYDKLLAEYNENLQKQVDQKAEHISAIQSKVLLGMADIVENRDDNTGGHVKRTSDVMEILVSTIKENNIFELDEQLSKSIIRAAPMHDIGKIGISDTILKKPARLDTQEFAVMKTHAEKGASMVERILSGVEDDSFVKVTHDIAKYHHERWDGTGYPEHLKGEEIPVEARIMAVADVYDALVSARCYKEPMSFDEAYKTMIDSMGSHFDPRLEKVFIMSREKLESYYSRV